ncbi:MAG: hypothetical protein QM703_01215 [Gemmatales bacterium]
MTRRWLLPFRFVFRHWLAFLLAVIFGFLLTTGKLLSPYGKFDSMVQFTGAASLPMTSTLLQTNEMIMDRSSFSLTLQREKINKNLQSRMASKMT